MAPTPHPPGRQRSGQLSATAPVAVVLPVQVLLLSLPLLQWSVQSRLLGLLLISRSKYSVGAINYIITIGLLLVSVSLILCFLLRVLVAILISRLIPIGLACWLQLRIVNAHVCVCLLLLRVLAIARFDTSRLTVMRACDKNPNHTWFTQPAAELSFANATKHLAHLNHDRSMTRMTVLPSFANAAIVLNLYWSDPPVFREE